MALEEKADFETLDRAEEALLEVQLEAEEKRNREIAQRPLKRMKDFVALAELLERSVKSEFDLPGVNTPALAAKLLVGLKQAAKKEFPK